MPTGRNKPSSKPAYLKFIPAICICVLGLIIYSHTLNYPFYFDDRQNIIQNLNIRNPVNLVAIWSFGPTHFITHLTLAINYHFNQLNVIGYHVFNLSVHLAAAMLVWWLSLLTFATPVMKGQKISHYCYLIALLAGLVFVSHPIQTQGVTYIIQRAASLTTLFYLATLALYVKFRLLKEQNPQTKKHRLYYTAALISTLLAMFSKETAVTLPAMILLYEFCFFRPKKGMNWKYTLALLATLPIIPLTRFLSKPVFFTKEGIQMPDLLPSTSSWNYLLTEFRVLVTYLRLLFLPLNQNLDYDYHIAKSIFEIPVILSFLFLLSILLLGIRIFKKYRLLSFGIFWFFLALLPESSIVPIRDVIFEHRLYLPMTGYCIFLVSAAGYLFAGKSSKPMVTTLLIIITAYSVLTYKRNLVWKDEVTLWSDALRKSPHKARVYNNRGMAYQEQGELDAALADYNQAIELDPELAGAYSNRAYIYQRQGNFEQAIAEYDRIIQIDANYTSIYTNRGSIYASQGRLDEALLDFNQAIEVNPKDAAARYNRGLLRKDTGNLDAALSDFNQAIKNDPEYAEAYNERGIVYAAKDNLALAVSDFSQAIKFKPKYAAAYVNRSIAYFFKKEYHKSWQDIHKAKVLGYQVNPQFLEELNQALK